MEELLTDELHEGHLRPDEGPVMKSVVSNLSVKTVSAFELALEKWLTEPFILGGRCRTYEP